MRVQLLSLLLAGCATIEPGFQRFDECEKRVQTRGSREGGGGWSRE